MKRVAEVRKVRDGVDLLGISTGSLRMELLYMMVGTAQLPCAGSHSILRAFKHRIPFAAGVAKMSECR